MTVQYEVAEAKVKLEELLERVRNGERITLAQGGTPVAQIEPIAGVSGTRIFGEFAGKVHLSKDFTAPLAGKELEEWEK